MPPKSIEEKTLTIPSPPRMAPTAAEAKRTSRTAIPPWNISSPAKMKNGIARSEKIEIPEMIRWVATRIGRPSYQKAAKAAMPSAKATGTPMMTPTPKSASSRSSPIVSSRS